MNERAKLQGLLEANKDRLYELRLRKAQMGPVATPVHYTTEIEKIEEEIRELENQISCHDEGSITSNDIPKVLCETTEQLLKRLGTDRKVTIRVFEIYVRPTGP